MILGSAHEHQRETLGQILRRCDDMQLREEFRAHYADINAEVSRTRAPDAQGTRGEVRRLCEKLVRPGAAEVNDIANIMMDIIGAFDRAASDAAAKGCDEGCDEFVDGGAVKHRHHCIRRFRC